MIKFLKKFRKKKNKDVLKNFPLKLNLGPPFSVNFEDIDEILNLYLDDDAWIYSI